MGRLTDFLNYLNERQRTVQAIEDHLCALQQKYETYFSEVLQVREHELQQLSEHVLADRAGEGSKLPGSFNEALDAARAEMAEQYTDQLKRLNRRLEDLQQQVEQRRQESVEGEKASHSQNVELDQQEEELKARNEQLLARIAEHNRTIKQLGKGWGFFANLFKMRALARQRKTLDDQSADLAARIEDLRRRWDAADGEHAAAEQGLRESWVDLQTEVATLQTKVSFLEESRDSIIARSALEQVLFENRPTLASPQASDPPCPRCAVPNPKSNHFCYICGKRLVQDRPDFEGSVAEMSELNLHHQRFSEGMRACQELIGLVRGIKSGVEAFTSSVADVQSSEQQYPLPKLNIDVPASSVTFGQNFDHLLRVVGQGVPLHPKAFAGHVEQVIGTVFTEDNIKDYFETMGEELSKQADSQW